MNKEFKFVEKGLLGLINKYQDGVRKGEGLPHTSEFVKRCLTRYGLPGAFQGYIRINERRANKQRMLLESNFSDKKEKSDRAKDIENKLLSLLFEFVVTPAETVATMVGQGKQIEALNQSLGAADWGDIDKTNKKHEDLLRQMDEEEKRQYEADTRRKFENHGKDFNG